MRMSRTGVAIGLEATAGNTIHSTVAAPPIRISPQQTNMAVQPGEIRWAAVRQMRGRIKVEQVEEHRPGQWIEAEAAGSSPAAVHQGAVALLAAPQAGAVAVRERAVLVAPPVWDPAAVVAEAVVAAGGEGKFCP